MRVFFLGEKLDGGFSSHVPTFEILESLPRAFNASMRIRHIAVYLSRSMSDSSAPCASLLLEGLDILQEQVGLLLPRFRHPSRPTAALLLQPTQRLLPRLQRPVL